MSKKHIDRNYSRQLFYGTGFFGIGTTFSNFSYILSMLSNQNAWKIPFPAVNMGMD